jgi:hypothetical protein
MLVTQEKIVASFIAKFNGVLKNALEWAHWDALVATLKAKSDGGWYVYYVGEEVPTGPLSPWQFVSFLEKISELLRREHDESYLGIVYVDDFENPAFVKIYDPNNLGSSCGGSGRRVLPSWVLSRTPPTDLHAALPNPGNRRRWWQSLFA